MITNRILTRLAHIQSKHAYVIVILAMIVTFIIGLGLPGIRLQTDISKELPQELDVIKLQNRVSDKFGGADTVIILVKLDRECETEGSPKDIRDPRIIKMLVKLGKEIEKEPSVNSVQSLGSFFVSPDSVPENPASLKEVINGIPDAKAFLNPDYSATLMFVSADLGKSEEKIENFVSRVRKDIESVEKPACTEIVITGNPPIRRVLMDMLRHDLVYTMGIAGVIIFILVIVLKKSLVQGILVFTPLALGLTWLLGLMGWFDIPLSIATVGVGAMILGLGTEYGVFLLERYREERKNGNDPSKALSKALPSVGSGIIGSGTTTIVGFLALLLAAMPMIQHLGETLALGIGCVLFATIVVAPAVIIITERVEGKMRRWKK